MSTAAGPATRLSWRHVVTLVAAVEAVATAAWLIPASVHIVSWSESGPERVALFAPLTRLRWLVAVGLILALALAALSRKAGLAARLAAMAAPLCLLWLWVVPYLPWLPDRVPLLLVLAGPIRWVVAGVALAGALRDWSASDRVDPRRAADARSNDPCSSRALLSICFSA